MNISTPESADLSTPKKYSISTIQAVECTLVWTLQKSVILLASLIPRPHPSGGKGSGILGVISEEVGHDAHLRCSHWYARCAATCSEE